MENKPEDGKKITKSHLKRKAEQITSQAGTLQIIKDAVRKEIAEFEKSLDMYTPTDTNQKAN